MTMNRTQYRAARRLYRDNGAYALHWMSVDARGAFQRLIAQREDIYADIMSFYRSVKSVGDRLTYRHRAVRVDNQLNRSWWAHPDHPRGTVCVLRESAGSTVALAVPQHSYREYSGCFSLL